MIRGLLAGAMLAAAARALLPRLLMLRFKPAVERLNAGDPSGMLDNLADDFVLRFNEGDHRWSGDWVGREGMERFLRNFIAAGLEGEIKTIATSGPPWALTMWVRFDDHADGPDGTRLYENRTVLLLRTRWGRVVEQEDFYLDTERITRFDRRLTELGIEPIAPVPPADPPAS